MKTVMAAVFAAGVLGAPAYAQSTTTTWNDLPDRFQVDAGYFRYLFGNPMQGSWQKNQQSSKL